jgi:L-ascorbate metabolism protein UlaG (beta-lactamase superfamily)
MRTIFRIFPFLLFCHLNVAYSQIPPHGLQIRYIANEGFLLETTTHKILIDALFKEGYGVFALPSGEVTDEIMNSKAPFDHIDMFLLTHYHKDHCDPVLINEFLSRYKNIPFVASKPSIVFIDGTCFGFIAKKKQIEIMTPELNQFVTKTIHTIPVKAFGLKHLSFYQNGIDLEETMFNVSFLFEMDGIKIFHSGDIEKNAFRDYLSKNKKWTDSVDVAFLYKGLLASGEPDLDYILGILHPKYIVVMHVLPGENEEWTAKTEKLRGRFPDIMFLKNSMDSETVSIR